MRRCGSMYYAPSDPHRDIADELVHCEREYGHPMDDPFDCHRSPTSWGAIGWPDRPVTICEFQA